MHPDDAPKMSGSTYLASQRNEYHEHFSREEFGGGSKEWQWTVDSWIHGERSSFKVKSDDGHKCHPPGTFW